MNITYIVGSFPKLSETFVLSQITGLIDMGHKVNIIAARPSGEEIVQDDLKEYGLLEKTTYLKGNSLKPGFEINAELLDALLFVDIIHAHFAAWPAEIAMALSKLTQIPFIFTAHAYDIFTNPDTERLKHLSQKASRIITVTEFNKNYILEMIGDEHKDKIELIRCGLDTEKFSPSKKVSSDVVTILTAGRLVEKKGINFAIKAFSQLSNKNHLEFRIIGSGPMKEILQSLVKELNLQNKIILLGDQPQSVVINEMKYADIFLLPCVTAENGDMEGLPLVLLEAQAMELPVVSSNHTGIHEGVINNTTGYLVPEKDVSAITEKLEMLINNPSLRLKMGQQGRKNIEERFNAINEIEKIEKLMYGLKSKVNISDISAERQKFLRSLVHAMVSELVLQKNEKIKQKDEKIKQKDEAINSLLNTWSWRITKPLRITAEWLK